MAPFHWARNSSGRCCLARAIRVRSASAAPPRTSKRLWVWRRMSSVSPSAAWRRTN